MPKITPQSPTQRRPAKVAAKTGSILDQAVDVSEIAADYVNILLYGKSGTGKTTLWSTWPRPIYVIVCSGGNETIALRREKGIKVHTLASSLDVPKIAEALATSEYKTVVLDHVTDFQGLILKELLGLAKIPEQLSWGLATQQQYGQIAVQFKEHIRSLLETPMNTVLVGQERESNTDGASEVLAPFIGVGLSPSSAGWVNTACEYICQTFIKQRTEMVTTMVAGKSMTVPKILPGVEYCLRTGPHPTYTTKFRVARGTKLPDWIVDPSYDKIMELISQQGG